MLRGLNKASVREPAAVSHASSLKNEEVSKLRAPKAKTFLLCECKKIIKRALL